MTGTATAGIRMRCKAAAASAGEGLYDLAGRLTSEWTTNTANTPATSTESHIFSDTAQIALRSGDNHTYFIHKNWLNTDRVQTDMNGATGATFSSLPFGDGGSETVSEGYAGWNFERFGEMELDTVSDTYRAQYRNYSQAQARWLVPDPYDGSYDASNPQSFNRYVYVLNNPLSLTDSSGLDWNYNPTDGCWDWGYTYTTPDGTEGSGTIDGCGYDAGYFYGGGFYGNPYSGELGDSGELGGGTSATPASFLGPTHLAVLSSAPSNTGCFVKGVVSGAVGAVVVGGVAAGAVALGVVSAPVATAALTGAAVLGGAALLINSAYDYATGNTQGLAYNAGSVLGGAAVGGLGARIVYGQLSPGQTFSGLSFSSLKAEFGQMFNPSMGPPNMNYWATGPTSWFAAGGPAVAGSGASVVKKGGC